MCNMATKVSAAHLESTAVLSRLEQLATATTVFISMPLIQGITPRILIEKGQKESSWDGEDTPRYCGLFRPDEVGLPVFDHGSLYGDGVFEGVLVVGERLFKWREHLRRLYSSADQLQLKIPYSPTDLTKYVLETVRKTAADGKTATYLRLVVTRGAGDLGIQPARCSSATVYCVASRIQLYPESLYDHGIHLGLCRNIRRSGATILDPQIKSCNYLNNILAWIEASGQGCHEALMLTQNGYIGEATTENLFVVTKDRGWEEDSSKVTIATPAAAYCLNGITRTVLLEYAQALGFRTDECATLLPTDLLGSNKEVFLTGTAAGLIPVITFDRQPIGNAMPGPLTRKLRHMLSADIENPVMGLSAYASEKEVAVYLDGLECHQAQMVQIAPDFVRNVFETIDNRHWPSLENFFSKNIIYERPGYAPLIGLDRVLRFYREERVIACGRHLLEQIVVDGNSGACWGRFIGEHKNGSKIDEGFADTYKFENGRIKMRKSYFFRPAV